MFLVWEKSNKQKLKKKVNIAAIWLDIANAWGFITHQLTFSAWWHYGVDSVSVCLFEAYYKCLYSFIWIFTGCTGFIILFWRTMNVIIDFIFVGIDFPLPVSGPLIKYFIDEIFHWPVLKSGIVNFIHSLLNKTSFVLNWARMSLKTGKSKSLVMVNGKKINNNNTLTLKVKI